MRNYVIQCHLRSAKFKENPDVVEIVCLLCPEANLSVGVEHCLRLFSELIVRFVIEPQCKGEEK